MECTWRKNQITKVAKIKPGALDREIGGQRLETMAEITIEDGITVSDAISILMLHLKKQKYKMN